MTNDLTPGCNPRLDWWMNYTNSLLRSGDYRVIVYRYNDRIIGFVDGFLLKEPSSGELHGVVQYLYVLSEFRIHSVAGKELYKAIIRYFIECHTDTIDFMCPCEDVLKWERRNSKPVYIVMRRRIKCHQQ